MLCHDLAAKQTTGFTKDFDQIHIFYVLYAWMQDEFKLQTTRLILKMNICHLTESFTQEVSVKYCSWWIFMLDICVFVYANTQNEIFVVINMIWFCKKYNKYSPDLNMCQ